MYSLTLIMKIAMLLGVHLFKVVELLHLILLYFLNLVLLELLILSLNNNFLFQTTRKIRMQGFLEIKNPTNSSSSNNSNQIFLDHPHKAVICFKTSNPNGDYSVIQIIHLVTQKEAYSIIQALVVIIYSVDTKLIKEIQSAFQYQ